MPDQIKLKCRPELLRQWHDDAAKNPRAFMVLLAMSPDYVSMLIHDALIAAQLLAGDQALAGGLQAVGSVAAIGTEHAAGHAIPGQTTEFVLRAMAFNYGEGPHQWDRLDRDACIAAADEIAALHAAAARHDKVPQVAGKFLLRGSQWQQVHPNSPDGEFLYTMREPDREGEQKGSA